MQWGISLGFSVHLCSTCLETNLGWADSFGRCFSDLSRQATVFAIRSCQCLMGKSVLPLSHLGLRLL